MTVNDPEALTPPERACQKQQVREKRCEVCVNRRFEGMAFGRPILVCSIGRKWPKRGICPGFVLDGVE